MRGGLGWKGEALLGDEGWEGSGEAQRGRGGIFHSSALKAKKERKTEGRLLCKRTVLFSLAKASFSRFLLSI